MSRKTEIRQKAIEIIESSPSGIRYSELVKKVQTELPNIPINTIRGSVWDLDKQASNIYKAGKGLFRHNKFKESEIVIHINKTRVRVPYDLKLKTGEDSFYQPFADWLVNEIEECTKAISLGGNKFKDKWGTPDVIGIREPRKSDIIKSPTEVVSAEVKIDTNNLITAFGQACSYKLFSHKSYIVIPNESSEEDIARLDALCRIFGIGLILFDRNNSKTPQFEIRVRASKHEPDMFYVNKYMRFVESEMF